MYSFPAKRNKQVNWLAVIGGVVVALAAIAAAAFFVCHFMKKRNDAELSDEDFDDECDLDDLCECDTSGETEDENLACCNKDETNDSPEGAAE